MKKYILAIDQGTTSSRVIIFDENFSIKATAQKEIKQIFPQDGWVEHNPKEILNSVLEVMKSALKSALNKETISGKQLAAIGITNQRETTFVWNKETGEPIYNAIVWQDRRTAEYCNTLQSKAKKIQKITGLLPDSYFSASKIRWILENVVGAKKLAKEEKLLFGTSDSWLIWNLTKEHLHLTDASNASRTMIYDIEKNEWSAELLELFGIPKNMLPKVLDNAADFGEIEVLGAKVKIGGVAGDQQAAAIGQACTSKGELKSTYGTGCFMILNTGKKKIPSQNKLLTTIAYRLQGKTSYALEGSIFIAGAAIQWLRDLLKIIKTSKETEALYQKADPIQAVYLIPAFTGLGAPYWKSDARGALFGLTRNTGIAELVKAAIDSVCYQTKDLVIAIQKDSGLTIKELKVDGGMVANDSFLQALSDSLQSKVVRPKIIETTALGAAYLAALQVGILQDLEEIKTKWQKDKLFSAKLDKVIAKQKYQTWQKWIAKLLN